MYCNSVIRRMMTCIFEHLRFSPRQWTCCRWWCYSGGARTRSCSTTSSYIFSWTIKVTYCLTKGKHTLSTHRKMNLQWRNMSVFATYRVGSCSPWFWRKAMKITSGKNFAMRRGGSCLFGAVNFPRIWTSTLRRCVWRCPRRRGRRVFLHLLFLHLDVFAFTI